MRNLGKFRVRRRMAQRDIKPVSMTSMKSAADTPQKPHYTHEEAEEELIEVTRLLAPYLDDESKLGLATTFGPRLIGRIAKDSGLQIPEVRRRLEEAYVLPSHLTSLTPAMARLLVRNYNWLCLDGLEEISDKSAEILSEFSGIELSLCKLSQPTTYQLKCIAASSVSLLHLSGLKSISQHDAVALGDAWDTLFLCGLEELSPKAAAQIIRNKTWLCVPALQGVTSEVIASLRNNANLERVHLSIGAGPVLGRDNARELSLWDGDLNLEGIEEITEEEAAWLGRCKSPRLGLPSLRELGAEHALWLSRYGGALCLPSLTTLSIQVFKNLFAGHSEVSLDGFQALTDEEAEVLRDSKAKVFLLNLKALSSQQAHWLHGRSAEIVLPCEIEFNREFKFFLRTHGEGAMVFIKKENGATCPYPTTGIGA